MEQIPIQITSLSEFESILRELDCRVTSKSTLVAYPGGIHWHIKKDGEPSGTLEMTQLIDGTAWFSTHRNRHQKWIDKIMIQFRSFLPG